MANGIGSLVVSRRFFQNLPQDLQKLLKHTGQVTGEKLIAATRKDNAESLAVLEQRGMEFVMDTEDLDSDEVKALSRKAGESLMENGYIPESTIQQVNQWLDDYRVNKSKEMVDVPG
jgi:TRAP-type C4-dicarboxylate transport system substrate-binding protein